MDLSLDQIIANKPKPVKAKKVAPAKVERNAKPIKNKQPYKQNLKQPFDNKNRAQQLQPNSKPSIFNRLGSQQHLVFFSNINNNITANDISDLASASGEVERVTMKRNGIVVAFGNKKHAIACVKSLNGVSLDNRPMIVKHGNGEAAIAGSKTVIVQPFQQGQKGGRRDDRDDRGTNSRGDRNNNKGPKKLAPKPPKTKTPEELDAEMDAYHNSKKAAPKTSEDLDAEMDAYMAAKKE